MTEMHADAAGRIARLEDRITGHEKETVARFAGIERKLDRMINDLKWMKIIGGAIVVLLVIPYLQGVVQIN